jgi:hypothetical protein
MVMVSLDITERNVNVVCCCPRGNSGYILIKSAILNFSVGPVGYG